MSSQNSSSPIATNETFFFPQGDYNALPDDTVVDIVISL